MNNVNSSENSLFGIPQPFLARQLKMAKARSTTGIYRVTRSCDGRYVYQYPDNGRYRVLTSKNIYTLKDKVLDNGLIWLNLNNVQIIGNNVYIDE